MSKEYLVQPKQYGDRKADYKKGEIINQKWKSLSIKEAFEKNPHGINGNVGMYTSVDIKTKKVSMVDGEYAYNSKTKAGLSETISAALALYRIICMLNNPIVESEGAAGYKVPWAVYLMHVETGKVLCISEWKGAFGIRTPFGSIKELPKTYKRDVIELLNLMFSDRSPHPYDDCTAGIVA
jgi:hypothetical protein